MGELDHLWAGWRSAYMDEVTATDAAPGSVPPPGGSGTLFERILALDDAAGYVVHRGERCSTLLNAYPYTSGHLLVLPNRGASELEQLEAATFDELWREVRDGVAALRSAYRLRWGERGHEPGPGRWRRGARPPARARRAPLERRQQLHDRCGPDPGDARDARHHLVQGPPGLAHLTSGVPHHAVPVGVGARRRHVG